MLHEMQKKVNDLEKDVKSKDDAIAGLKKQLQDVQHVQKKQDSMMDKFARCGLIWYGVLKLYCFVASHRLTVSPSLHVTQS